MASIEEMRDNFDKRLNDAKQERDERLAQDVDELKDAYTSNQKPGNITSQRTAGEKTDRAAIAKRGTGPADRAGHPAAPVSELINMTDSISLRSMDDYFVRAFDLTRYFPVDALAYPTILCETLEEFCASRIANEVLSPQARQEKIMQTAAYFRQRFDHGGGYIGGVNIDGQGCYINGWVYASMAKIGVDELENYPEVMVRILSTAAHEKLGHGFITAYSTKGQLESKLGLTKLRIASQFGLTPADDPESQLREKQRQVLFFASVFLEEGWSTWIQHYFEARLNNAKQPQEYTIQQIEHAIKKMKIPEKNGMNAADIKEHALAALAELFKDERSEPNNLFFAIRTLGDLDKYFYAEISSVLGQPLRYALGELLCRQCEQNLGIACVPYAILIAANITFDPEKISFSDLRSLLETDPRLHPDARLAAISRIKLDNPGDIQEMTQKVNAQLSLSIPPELN